jgi:hypothetical protein
MSIELILRDLRDRFGNRLVLYSPDLAVILDTTEEAMTNLITRQELPFQVKLIGDRRCVDIYQIATWLAASGLVPVAVAPKEAKQKSGSPTGTAAKPSSRSTASTPVRSKMAEQILRMRHEKAGLLAGFSPTYRSEDERLFIWEVIEALLFVKRLPPSRIVLTRSSSTPLVNGGGVVNETNWQFDNIEVALERTKKAWTERFGKTAFRLVLRQGRRVIFRGHVFRDRAEALIDMFGCAEESIAK